MEKMTFYDFITFYGLRRGAIYISKFVSQLPEAQKKI